MRQYESDLYVDEQVVDRLSAVSAHQVELGFGGSGGLDPRDIDPEYDVSIDEDLTDYEFPEGADPYPVVDVLNSSFISEIELDTDRGFFRFETDSGEEASGWMPYLEEGNAEGIFLKENPWTEQSYLEAFDRSSDLRGEVESLHPMFESAYIMAREHVAEGGIRNNDYNMQDIKSEMSGFTDVIRELEETGSVKLDDSQHEGQIRGGSIAKVLPNMMRRVKDANLIDYSVANPSENLLTIESGGYKTLTVFPDSAPYSSMNDAIEFRYPDSWLEREES